MLQLVPTENILQRLERLIGEAVRSGRYNSPAQVLKLAGKSSGYLGEFRERIAENPSAGMSGRTASRFAEILGVSEGHLLRGEGPAPSELVDVYVERAEAIDAARKLKFPEAAIRAVLREDPGGRPSAMYWFRRIESEAERVAPPADSGSHKI
jgi:hypothetical protein